MALEEYTPDLFISDRVLQYKSWYNEKAIIAKSRYLKMQGFSVVAGSIVPVLINIPDNYTFFGIPFMKIIVTAISIMVVVTVSLEGVLHYREQWKNYRSTEQYIGHEVIAFRAKIGPYSTLTSETAFKLFVERIEDAIRSENAATLNIMTTTNNTSGEKHE